MKFTPVREIVYISAADDYSEVHLQSGRVVMVDVPLKRWETRLPAKRFLRVHRSTILQLSFVDEVSQSGGRWLIKLRGDSSPGASLPMSRRAAQQIRRLLEPDSLRAE